MLLSNASHLKEILVYLKPNNFPRYLEQLSDIEARINAMDATKYQHDMKPAKPISSTPTSVPTEEEKEKEEKEKEVIVVEDANDEETAVEETIEITNSDETPAESTEAIPVTASPLGPSQPSTLEE